MLHSCVISRTSCDACVQCKFFSSFCLLLLDIDSRIICVIRHINIRFNIPLDSRKIVTMSQDPRAQIIGCTHYKVWNICDLLLFFCLDFDSEIDILSILSCPGFSLTSSFSAKLWIEKLNGSWSGTPEVQSIITLSGQQSTPPTFHVNVNIWKIVFNTAFQCNVVLLFVGHSNMPVCSSYNTSERCKGMSGLISDT